MSDTVFYVLSAVLSVAVLLGIHWMSKVETAVRGNRLSALAMLCAIILTFIKHDLLAFRIIKWYVLHAKLSKISHVGKGYAHVTFYYIFFRENEFFVSYFS